MRDRIMLTFLISELLLLLTGVVLLAVPLATAAALRSKQTASTVATNLLLGSCPLSASIGNAVVVFVTVLLALPAVIIPTTRGWLKIHGYMVVICAIFTLVLGLNIWFETLKTRSNLDVIWTTVGKGGQSLLQQEFNCCGYVNSTTPPFVIDTTCPNANVANSKGGCITPFSSFANNYLDVVFTAAFGIVGVDVAVILATAMLMKDRKDRARYRIIDEKNGITAI